MVFQVAKLMHDDVLDAMCGHLNKVYIECYSAFAAATSPTCTHGANHQQRFGHTVARRNIVTFFQVPSQGLSCTFSIPLIDSFLYTLDIVSVFDPNPEKPTQQFCQLLRLDYLQIGRQLVISFSKWFLFFYRRSSVYKSYKIFKYWCPFPWSFPLQALCNATTCWVTWGETCGVTSTVNLFFLF